MALKPDLTPPGVAELGAAIGDQGKARRLYQGCKALVSWLGIDSS